MVALGAGSSVELLAEQANRVRPEVVALADNVESALSASCSIPGIAIEVGTGRLVNRWRPLRMSLSTGWWDSPVYR